MDLEVPPFVHEFTPGTIHLGRGATDDLGESLADRGVERAMVVCGSNVGANRAVMNSVEAGLGDLLVAVFDRTTPDKELETAYDGVERMREAEVDALVAVGGGSSIDVATVMSALDADFRSLEEVQQEVRMSGHISAPADRSESVPVFPVPTTLAGAELNPAGGILVPMGEERVGTLAEGASLKPPAVFYDPSLFETTPTEPFVRSAMNGFDKGIEALYSRHANPLTDAMAVRGLEYLRPSLSRFHSSDDREIVDRIVVGIVLVQHGCSVGNSLVHSYGHALRRHFGIQQGLAHAVVVPHALGLLFDDVDGRRDLLAQALVDGDRPSDPAAAVVEQVAAVRDALELPSRLRDLEAVSEDGLSRVAELTHEDPNMDNVPEGFAPTVEELEAVLREAW